MFEIVEALDFPLDPRQDRHVLPPGIETMPPGPDLASALAGVDRSTLNGFELMVTLQARARQIAYEQAEYFADIVELTYSDFGGEGSQPDRRSDPDEGIADELRAGLTLTRTAANYQLDIAFGLNGLPAVGEALRRGSIDLAKARVFINETGHLLPHEAESVAGAGLEHASEMTTGQLGARLRRLGMEADPEAASGRYREGLDDRRVEKRSNPDGTAELWARQLPVDRLAAIWDRLDRVAHTMRGDGRLLDQIRADILMDFSRATTSRESPEGEPLRFVSISPRSSTWTSERERSPAGDRSYPISPARSSSVSPTGSGSSWLQIPTPEPSSPPASPADVRLPPSGATSRRSIPPASSWDAALA